MISLSIAVPQLVWLKGMVYHVGVSARTTSTFTSGWMTGKSECFWVFWLANLGPAVLFLFGCLDTVWH